MWSTHIFLNTDFTIRIASLVIIIPTEYTSCFLANQQKIWENLMLILSWDFILRFGNWTCFRPQVKMCGRYLLYGVKGKICPCA
jgi:hypothetical protein